MRYIFYALFSETKSKELNMKGPFIHMKPLETVESEDERYYIEESEVKKECKYLTQKHNNDTVIFKVIESMLVPDHNNIRILFKDAETFFTNKFDIMAENYRICSK